MVVANKYPNEKAVAERIRAAFDRFGANPAGVSQAAQKVAGSEVRDRLVAALDRWLQAERSAHVREVLRAIDSHTYRDAVRDAVLAGDRKKVAELADRPEALIQPTGFALVLGESLTGRIVYHLQDDSVMVGSDMFNPAQTVKVDRKDILSIEPSKMSPMPDGLLSSLTQDEVLDLLAYLAAGSRAESTFR